LEQFQFHASDRLATNPQRRVLRNERTLGTDGMLLVCPTTPASSACKVVVTPTLGADAQPFARTILRDTVAQEETLPDNAVPEICNCRIIDEDPEGVAARRQELIDHLQRAARLARNAEIAGQRNYSTQQEIEDYFLEDYYMLLDPDGVAETLAENKLVEGRLCNIEVNYLGHLLVGDPNGFCKRLEEEPSDVSAELIEIAGVRPASSGSHRIMSHSEYEDAYLSHVSDAFEWQESMNEELCLRVMRLLREHVKQIDHFIYVE
jgi:hypothetical protein